MKVHDISSQIETRVPERGATLIFVAVSLFLFIAVAGLAIDLANLYVARSDAQRAADAAALAAATEFVTSGYTTGSNSIPTFQVERLAREAARAVGSQNLVNGQSPNIDIRGGDFNLNACGSGLVCNPQVTVNVSSAPINTFFMQALGLFSNSVSATATAEAYNPSGQPAQPLYCTSCIKPIAVPNSDPSPNNANPNAACPVVGPAGPQFINPATGAICNPGTWGPGNQGIVGEEIGIQGALGDCATLQALPNSALANPPPLECSTTGVWQPLSLDGLPWAQAVTTCDSVLHTCADPALQIPAGVPLTEGPIDQLIHANLNSAPPGPCPPYPQDAIVTNSSACANPNPLSPFAILSGSANPFFAPGIPISQSDSIVTVPVYDPPTGTPIVGTTVGFMQLFIEYAYTNPTSNCAGAPCVDIVGVVLNISGCGTNGGACGGGGGGGSGSATAGGGGGFGSSGSISGGGVSTVPVRLIQNPGP
jgi:Flp pilus assembly protein TadG